MDAPAPAGRIPLDVSGFGRAAALTRAARLGLAVAILATAAPAVVLATRSGEAAPTVIPRGSSGLIVLDVSGSISTRAYETISKTLREAAASGQRYGLVVFSDVAYEALPPGTEGAELRTILRYFVPLHERGRFTVPAGPGLFFLANPWAVAFTGGTRISAGLEVARAAIRRERLEHPAVVLVSDLGFDPEDGRRIAALLQAYRREGIGLRVVPLDPDPLRAAFFERAMRGSREVDQGPRLKQVQVVPAPDARRGPAIGLLAAALVLLGLLAANELACARLTWAAAGARHS